MRPHRESPGSHSRRRRWIVGLAVVAAALVAARVALPSVVQRYAERVLDETEGYDGRIADVDLALIRGAYRIEGLEIWKTEGKVPVPFVALDEADLSIAWKELFHGGVVGEIWLDGLQVNFVAGPRDEQVQTGAEVPWTERAQELFPVRIDRFVIRRGAVHFRDPWNDPPVDVALRNVELVAHNLTNVRDAQDERPADVRLEAVPFGAGRVEAEVELDPFAPKPDFFLRFAARGVQFGELNGFLRAYAGLDVQRGTIDVLTELEAKNGAFDGYVKPLVRDLDVLRLEEEAGEQSLLATAWEAFAGAVAELFQNQPAEQQAAQIPIRGRFDDPQIGVLPAIASVLRNAFGEALKPTFDTPGRDGGSGD